MAKSEGKTVREAFDGPDIEHDELIAHMAARNIEDSERASSAGESRQKIGAFLDETGMNSRAYSWIRSILKQKTREKQMDIIRSLKASLPMVEAHVAGQTTPDMFDDPVTPADDDEGDFNDDAVPDFDDEDDNVVPFGEAV
jgi:hypothetical protein